MPHTPPASFGIMTAPMQVDYHDVLRVWREADTIPEIEGALVEVVGDIQTLGLTLGVVDECSADIALGDRPHVRRG